MKKETFVLYLSMFIMGACGLAYEYTLSKVASDILGNSVRQWAIIIGIMMFFMGVGSDFQKYITDNNLIDKFIFWELLLGFLGAFGPIALLWAFSVMPLQYILVQYFFIVSIGFIIGLEIPLITRINQNYISELKINLAGVLKMDYIGALAGSLSWIFILPLFFSFIQSAFVLGILNLLVGLITLFFFKKHIHYFSRLLFFSIFAFLLVGVGFINSESWTTYSEQRLYRDKIIFSETTEYQHIVLTKSSNDILSCYINGHLQFSSNDEFIYHELLVHPAMLIAPNRSRILILGGGDGLAVREVLKYPDVQEVVLCDIDPEMTRLAQNNEFFIRQNDSSLFNSRLVTINNKALINSGEHTVYSLNRRIMHTDLADSVARVKIINIDAALFVEQFSGSFNVIIMDFPDPNHPDLGKLYSKKFYEQVRRLLSADGVMVQQSTSPYHAKELFLSIGRTMENSGFSVLPYKDNVPSFGEWGWWLAVKKDFYKEANLAQKITEVENIPIETSYLTSNILHSALHFGKDQLNSEETKINTIANGQAYKYYQQAFK